MDKAEINLLVQRLAYDINKAFSKRLESVNLTYNQWNILKSIKNSNEIITQKDLSKCFNIPKGTLSGIIKKLVLDGYLQEIKSDKDRRENILLMSQKSNLLCNKLQKIENEFNEDLFKNLNKTELERLILLIKKISI